MSKTLITTLKKLSRENHDPRFPPEAFRDLPKIRADTEQKLRVCNTEITRIECHLERLYIERDALEKQLDLVLSLRAPIRSLPTSLLQDILIETTSTQMRAFKLSKICSHWRSVVADCPAFWSNLDMDDRMWRHPDAGLILDHFLSRSRVHPLSAVFRKTLASITGDRENLPLLWGLLGSLSKRWASLNLSLGEITQLDELITSSFSSLENLSLSVTNSPSEETDWSTGFPAPARSVFPDAPLRSVSLAQLRPVTLDLPWESLTALEFLSVTFLPIDLQILSRCLRLQVLRLSDCGTRTLAGDPLPEWNIPITTMELDAQSNNCSLPVCPKLTTFNLHNRRTGWGPAPMTSLDLTRTLARYGGKMQTLSLELMNLSPILPFLLSVLNAPISYPVPDESPHQPDLLCPNLTELSVSLSPKHADEAITSILSVIHTRRETGFKRLKLRLHLYIPRTWERSDPATVPLPYDITSLRCLVAQGIQVMVMHTRSRHTWEDHGEVDSCEVWHVLDEEEPGKDENKDQNGDENGRQCGIQCHFFDIPQFNAGGFGGRRWRPGGFWGFQAGEIGFLQ